MQPLQTVHFTNGDKSFSRPQLPVSQVPTFKQGKQAVSHMLLRVAMASINTTVVSFRFGRLSGLPQCTRSGIFGSSSMLKYADSLVVNSPHVICKKCTRLTGFLPNSYRHKHNIQHVSECATQKKKKL